MNRLKVKGLKKLYHGIINQKKIAETILIPNKIDFM